MCKNQSYRKLCSAPVVVLLVLYFISNNLHFGIHGAASAADSVFYDFIAQAASASWSSAAGNLPFPGSEADARGFALYRNNWQLEDNKTWAKVLETHPQWVSNGWILGRYPEITVPSDAELKVTVGFFNGATTSDGVIFEVRFEEFRGLESAPKQYTMLSHGATYDGKLDSITKELGSIQGKTGNFVLYVNAGQNSGKDWAAWAEAKIEELPPAGQPDLYIIDVWYYGDTPGIYTEIRYTLMNGGDTDAGPSTTALYIDGVKIGEHRADGIGARESRVEHFPFRGQCSGTSDTFRAMADSYYEVSESDETNNEHTRVHSCPGQIGLPDLDLRRIWHEGEEEYYYAGREYTAGQDIRFLVRNSGNSSSPAAEARLYIDDTWSSTHSIPALDPGEEYEGRFGYVGVCSGTNDTIHMVVDPSHAITEVDESNNEVTAVWDCIVQPPSNQTADLHIRSMWLEPLGDGKYRIGYTIENLGTRYAPYSETGLYFDDVFQVADGVDRLAPGERRDEEFWLIYDSDWCTSETDFIRAVADYQEEIEETDARNNEYSLTYECPEPAPPPKPDLVIPTVWYDYEPGPFPRDLYIRYSITNQGTAPAGPSVTRLYINYQEIATSSVPALAPGETIGMMTFEVRWTAQWSENHVQICADASNTVDEITPEPSGELNNCLEADWVFTLSCDDSIRNQGEEDVDCGGPCPSCAYVMITGRILYEEADASGNTINYFKPARYLKFRIEGGINTNTKITDGEGRFRVAVPRDRNVGEEIHIHIGGCSMYNGGFNYAVKIAKDLDKCNEYIWFESRSILIPEKGNADFGDLKVGISVDLDFDSGYRDGAWRAGDDPCRWSACGRDNHDYNGGAAYFNIAETILVAREYIDDKRDRRSEDSPGKVTVEWPDSEWPNYTAYWEEIKLRTDFGFTDGTIIHEYGHHLEKTISQHDVCMRCNKDRCVLSCDHEYCSDKNDTEFAWSEGFAEYFGTIVPYHHRDDPAHTDPRFLSGPNIDYSEAETLPCTDSAGNLRSGKDIEGTVVNVLWDLVDDPDVDSDGDGNPDFPDSIYEDFDTIGGQEVLIFWIFDWEMEKRKNSLGNWAEQVDAPDLCEFIREGWDCRLDGSDRDAIDALLAHYKVSCERGCGK